MKNIKNFMNQPLRKLYLCKSTVICSIDKGIPAYAGMTALRSPLRMQGSPAHPHKILRVLHKYRKIIASLLALFMLSPLVFAQSSASLIVESIEIVGNSKSKTHVIQNYLTIVEGQPVTRQQLAADRFRLLQTHFFKDVEMLITPGSEKGLAKVTIKVTERKWPFLQFKSGFNELDGWYISPLGLRFDNIFGRGNILGFELLIGDRVGGARLEYVRPFLFGTEYDFGVQLFGYNREFLHFFGNEQFNQQINDNGIQLQLRGNSGLAKYFSGAFVAENVIADTFLTRGTGDNEQRFDVPGFLSVPGDTQKIRRFVLAATVDTRDQKLNPASGWWGSLTLDQSSKELGSFASYFRLTADIRRYQPLYKKLIGAVRFRWGQVSDSAPFYEKFYLGGPNSLRGYEDRSLTPAGYAANITQGSAELRFPLSRRLRDGRLIGVLFYDAGFAWNDPEKFDFSHLKSGVGFGVRVRLPIAGLLRLDIAYPLPANGNDDLRVHLSLGHTF